MDDREPDLLDGGHAPHAVIDRMGFPHVGQFRHMVQLCRGQGHGGGIVDEVLTAVGLDDRLAPDGVVLIVLHQVGGGVGLLVPGHLLIGGHPDGGIPAGIRGVGGIAGALHLGDLPNRRPLGQQGSDLRHGPLAHAVDQDVGLGIEEDGAADLVLPVVVVGEAAEGGLQTADDDGDVPINFSDLIGVDDGGPVGAIPRPVAGGVGIVVAALPGGGVMGHHGVDVAAVDEDPVSGLAEDGEGLVLLPVGLGQDAHPVALILQHTADDGRAKGGVVHVGVAGDQQEVIVVPVPGQHILFRNGQEFFEGLQNRSPRLS